MKKILFLGAAPTQVPPLLYAKSQGHYVITCDYLPDNPGHKLADASYSVSTTDQDAVLALAQLLQIDAIVAYASDPAAPTAAYVAEHMGLPGNPYWAVQTLARKDLFRDFLKSHGFNVPSSKSFRDMEDARQWFHDIGSDAFVKPVDSSGSKGVTRAQQSQIFERAFAHAMNYSREKMVVVETPIPRAHYQVAGDGFLLDGQLIFRCWADEHFDKLCNGLVPIGQSFPTSHRDDWLDLAHKEAQRLLTLLGMKNGALNFDFVFDAQGQFYFVELGPRNGGCQIPEVIRYATGVDLIKHTVDAALGLPCAGLSMQPVQGYWSSYVVHALVDGVFKSLWLSERIQSKLVEQTLWVQVGDPVQTYSGSNHTLGTMIFRFDSMSEMLEMLDNMENDVRVICE